MPLMLNGFTDHSINTGEVEIAYSVGPDNGPTLLLLHGATSRRDTFMRVMDELTARYRVITIDQRGHGLSGHTPGHYAREDHARDIRFIFENVCREPTTAWGHSMGGGNIIATAADDPPGNLNAIVLEDAALFGRRRPASTNNSPTMNQFRLFLELVDSGATRDEVAAAILKQNPDWPDYVAAWKAETVVQMDPSFLRMIVEGRIQPASDPAETLARIACPVLLMQADPEHGGILPDNFLAEVIPDTPNWTVTKIHGAGHNINREHPEKVLPVVMPWLAEHAA